MVPVNVPVLVAEQVRVELALVISLVNVTENGSILHDTAGL